MQNCDLAYMTPCWRVRPAQTHSTSYPRPWSEGDLSFCLSVKAAAIYSWELPIAPHFLLQQGEKSKALLLLRGSQVLRSKPFQNEVCWGKGGSMGSQNTSARGHIPRVSKKQESGAESACLKLLVLKGDAKLWYSRDQRLPKNTEHLFRQHQA